MTATKRLNVIKYILDMWSENSYLEENATFDGYDPIHARNFFVEWCLENGITADDDIPSNGWDMALYQNQDYIECCPDYSDQEVVEAMDDIPGISTYKIPE